MDWIGIAISVMGFLGATAVVVLGYFLRRIVGQIDTLTNSVEELVSEGKLVTHKALVAENRLNDHSGRIRTLEQKVAVVEGKL